MIKLSDWYFTMGNHAHAHGVVACHPRLADGTSITTSAIEKVKLEKDRLVVLTHSLNSYEMKLEDINMNTFDTTVEVLKDLGVSGVEKDVCQKLAEASKVNLMEKVDKILRNSELYLQMAGIYTKHAFFKNNLGEVREVGVSVHIGTFTDSYLVTDWNKGEVDFRYFDKGMAIEPYHWSDGLEAVYIENIGDTDLLYKCRGKHIYCKADEVTRIDKEDKGQEGLFSPDAVNGKSLLSDFIAEDEFDKSKE